MTLPSGRWAELLPEGEGVLVVIYQNTPTPSGVDRPWVVGYTARPITEDQALDLIKPSIPVYKNGQLVRS